MDFELSIEQKNIQDLASEFSKKILAPRYQLGHSEKILSRDIMSQMGDSGLLGLRVKEEYGGTELDCLTTGVAIEQLAKGDFNYAALITSNALAGEIIQNRGNESLKEEWLPGIAEGKKLVAFALTEPDAGSDSASMRASAVRDGEDYILNGSKSGITFAQVADSFIVFAKTDLTKRSSGVTAFVVPNPIEGLTVQPMDDIGGGVMCRAMLFLDNLRLPERYRVGAEGTGFNSGMMAFDYSRALIGLACLGVARQTLDETINFVKERTAFGKPIGRYEGISFRIAEMETQIEMARGLAFKTLWLRDQNRPHTKEAAMCKWYMPKLTTTIIHDCLVMHGQYGYGSDMPLGQRLLDVMGLEIGDGTLETQKLIIVRETMGREFLPY